MAFALTEPAKNPRPARASARPKNRVWGSPRFPNKTRPADRPELKQPRRENAPCSYKPASGVSYERYRYSPFGQLEIYGPQGKYLGNTTKHSKIKNKRTWNTRIQDPDTNLHMYKHRHYSAELGRFISRDPIGEDGGPNLYAFVHNNPLNWWDVLGEWVAEAEMLRRDDFPDFHDNALVAQRNCSKENIGKIYPNEYDVTCPDDCFRDFQIEKGFFWRLLQRRNRMEMDENFRKTI